MPSSARTCCARTRSTKARPHLELAYRGDPFSAPNVNTLRLIDSFDNFVLSEHPAKPAAPGSNAASNPGALLRLHKDEAAVLEPYVLDLVNRTIEAYSKRYDFELKQPVIVELYPDHDDFAVRIAGLPGIGLLGVTFGYLVAMDSPTGRADERLSLGHDAVARDGARVHARGDESSRAALVQRRRLGLRGVEHRAAARAGTFRCPCSPPSRRTSSCPWRSSTAASSARPTRRRSSCRTCRPGSSASTSRAASARKRWRACSRRSATARTRRRPSRPRSESRRASSTRTSRLTSIRSSAPSSRSSSSGKRSRRELQQSVEAADWRLSVAQGRRGHRALPRLRRRGQPLRRQGARASRARRDGRSLTNTLLEYRRRGGYDPDALITLARTLGEAGRNDECARRVRGRADGRAAAVPRCISTIGDRLTAANRPREALVEYQALLAMNPQDLAEAHYRVAKTYVALEDRAKGREHLLYALEIAPHYREAQQLLLEVVR